MTNSKTYPVEDEKRTDMNPPAIEMDALADPATSRVELDHKLFGSQRLLITFLLGLSAFAFYAQRQSFNMTILCMVDHRGLNNLTSAHHNHSAACRVPLSSPITDEEDDDIINGPYLWQKHIQGMLLGSFFWGYCMQLFGGILSGIFGPRNVLTAAVFVSSATTLLIPIGAKFHYILVAILRLLCGLVQGFMYPCCLPMISKWTPPEERGKLTSFMAAGSSLGIILATAITGPICKTGHWYLNYVMLAAIGFVWLGLWFYFGASCPEESRHISDVELKFLQRKVEKTGNDRTRSIKDWPLKSIITSKGVWTIIATNMLSDFTLYGIFSVFPLYLWEVFNFSVVTNSYISAAEYALMWVATVVAGFFSDYFIQKRIMNRLNTRKFFNSVGMIIPALLFPIIGYMSCDNYKYVIILLILGGGFQGTFINAGYLINTVDISGSYSGIVIGISNSLGSISGILAPLVANILTKNRTQLEWRTCFLVFSAVLFLAGVIFLLFSKGKLEEWATERSEKDDFKSEFTDQESTVTKITALQRHCSMDSKGPLVFSDGYEDQNDFPNSVVIVRPGNNKTDVNVENA